MTQKYKRLRTVDLEQVLPVILSSIPNGNPNSKDKVSATIDDVLVKVSSLRLRTFAIHGTTCSSCGLQASFFAFENNGAHNWHLNLYGTKEDKDVLFTHDHTLARSAGGTDRIENTTTMCSPCNFTKSLTEPRHHN